MDNINLDSLSKTELIKIKSLIHEEILKRNAACTKSSLNIYDRIYCALSDNLKEDGCTEESIYYTISPMVGAIFELCDITLKNYNLKHTKQTDDIMPVRNKQHLQVDPDRYKSMCYDIVLIINKYATENKK